MVEVLLAFGSKLRFDIFDTFTLTYRLLTVFFRPAMYLAWAMCITKSLFIEFF